jgi:transcriptional regulator with XRE-family HTH domain
MQEKEQIKSTIKQRILQFVDNLDVSKRGFYGKTGISRGTLEGTAGITEDTLVKFIANYPNVNLIWLLTGDGDMLLSNTRPEPENWIASGIDYSTARYSHKDLLRVGARIDEICYAYGITHKQLAIKTRFDYNELKQIINGSRPAPLELLQKIGELFENLSIAWLYCGKGSMLTIDIDDDTYYDTSADDAIDRYAEQYLKDYKKKKKLEQKWGTDDPEYIKLLKERWKEDKERTQKQVEEWLQQTEEQNPSPINEVAIPATKEKKQRKSIATTQKKHIK